MSTRKVVQDILGSEFPDWKDTASLPPDLVLLCVDYLAESHVMYYPDTTTKAIRGVTFNGRRYGKWTERYENGQRKSRTLYVKGRKHGKHKSWFSTGNVEEKGVYVRGKEAGQWLTYHDKKNHIQSDRSYSKGKLHGVSRVYYESGQLASEAYYRHGKQHGTNTHWCENGTIFYMDTYRHGKRHGDCKWWDYDGELQQHSRWEDGILVGKMDY